MLRKINLLKLIISVVFILLPLNSALAEVSVSYTKIFGNTTTTNPVGFSDSEIFQGSTYAAGALDFSLSTTTLNIILLGEAIKINVNKDGSLPFQYIIKAKTGNNDFCRDLYLKSTVNGNTYFGQLKGFNSATTTISSLGEDNWEFEITDPLNNTSGKTCQFEFIFEAWQEDLDLIKGFTDKETVLGTVKSGIIPSTPGPGDVVINEVYYDVDKNHGTEGKNEWIELYNNTDQDISLKNWALTDNASIKTINANISIPANGFAVLSHNNSTWALYWDAYGAITINLGGSKAWLNNNGDHLILKDNLGQKIDFVAWEKGYNNSYLDWDISADEGKSIARKFKGVDTDSVSDWEVLDNSNPGTNSYHDFNYESEIMSQKENKEKNMDSNNEFNKDTIHASTSKAVIFNNNEPKNSIENYTAGIIATTEKTIQFNSSSASTTNPMQLNEQDNETQDGNSSKKDKDIGVDVFLDSSNCVADANNTGKGGIEIKDINGINSDADINNITEEKLILEKY